MANRFILKPSRNALEASGQSRRLITVASHSRSTEQAIELYWIRVEGGESVQALACEANAKAFQPEQFDSPQLLILKFPGTAGRAERSTLFPASLTPAQTAEVWTWNPPGYGASTGRAQLSQMVPAGVEFVRAVQRLRANDNTRVWICGNSLGSAIGLGVAAQIRVDGLVLRNPPPLVEIVRSRDAWWNCHRGGRYVAQGIPKEMDARVSAQQVDAATLFIESEADTLVLPRFQAMIRSSHRGPQKRIVLRGAEHNSAIPETYREELRQCMAWLWNQNAKRNE